MKWLDWCLRLVWKLIGRKPVILPSSISSSNDDRIVVTEKGNLTDLGTMLIQVGNATIKDVSEVNRLRRIELIGSKELKTYFSNIWKYIGENYECDSRFIISSRSIGCTESDYDVVITLFKEALLQASIEMNIEKSGSYYFFGEYADFTHWKKVMKQLWGKKTEINPLQLSQGKPYR